jgi:hypothetical protein
MRFFLLSALLLVSLPVSAAPIKPAPFIKSEGKLEVHLLPRDGESGNSQQSNSGVTTPAGTAAGALSGSSAGASVGSSSGASSSSSSSSASSAAGATATNTPTAPPITHKVAEDDLKLELRDIHECLRRVEGALSELRREADRHQMVVANPMQNDLGVMDPWSAACPGMMPYQGQPEMVAGAYLPPRPAFLKHSCDHLDGAFNQLSTSIDKLPALIKISSAFTDPLDASKAKADSEVLKDSTEHLGIKFSELRKFCTAEEPDNASLINSVSEFDQVIKGMDEVAKRLWKDENP